MKVENLAVCLPYSQGIHVYLRRTGEEKLMLCPSFADCAISDIPLLLAPPRLVVLVGEPWGTFLGQILIQEADLCVVPDRWLEHIPYWERLQKAEFAVHLIEAYISAPIRHYGAKDAESRAAIRAMESSLIDPFRTRHERSPRGDDTR